MKKLSKFSILKLVLNNLLFNFFFKKSKKITVIIIYILTKFLLLLKILNSKNFYNIYIF